MCNKGTELRLDTVRHYLNSSDSLRKTALKFHVAYRTVFKWVRLHKEKGEVGLYDIYKRPWNRTSNELEERVILLKEKHPYLTIRRAREILAKEEGLLISITGIWGIWKRYGYAGFKKRDTTNVITNLLPWTKEAAKKYDMAKNMFAKGNLQGSSKVLNSMPVLPSNDLVFQIPDSFLNLRRKIEKTTLLFGKIPVNIYLKKIRDLHNECEKTNLRFLKIRVEILEVMTLGCTLDTQTVLKRIEELKDTLNQTGNLGSYLLFAPHVLLLISEAIAYTVLLEMEKACDIAGTCRRLLRRKKSVSPYLMVAMGTLCTYLQDFKEAEYWYSQSMNDADEELKKAIKESLAEILSSKGEYVKAIRILRSIKSGHWGYHARILRFQSMQCLVSGEPRKAIVLATDSLPLLKKEAIHTETLITFFIIATAYYCLGEKMRAEHILKRQLEFLTKSEIEFKEGATIYRIILSQIRKTNVNVPADKGSLPTTKLLFLLMSGNYQKALEYVQEKGILSNFQRYVVYFPELVTNVIQSGKSTGLPKTMLRLPVFNNKPPVYNIRFLGELVVYPVRECSLLGDRKKMKQVSNRVNEDQDYIKTKLTPKDSAFLIHFALKAGEPGKDIFLDDLYDNFWKSGPHSSRNLSHLLVRIKKAINVPPHLLEVSSRRHNPVLTNKGIYFITDYHKYQASFAQAKALERAGEWEFARKEYLRAFKLFRGEPFKKMYDNWSEQMRGVILNRLETEAIRFAKSCIEHDNKIRQKKRRTPSAKCHGGNMADARKVLEKISTILPYSEEIRKMVK